MPAGLLKVCSSDFPRNRPSRTPACRCCRAFSRLIPRRSLRTSLIKEQLFRAFRCPSRSKKARYGEIASRVDNSAGSQGVHRPRKQPFPGPVDNRLRRRWREREIDQVPFSIMVNCPPASLPEGFRPFPVPPCSGALLPADSHPVCDQDHLDPRHDLSHARSAR